MENWRGLQRHPLSGEYKNISGRPWNAFVQNLKDNGNVNGRKVVLYEGQVLDGWQFYRAHKELDIEPPFWELPANVSPEVFVSTVNDFRRHETQAKAMKRASERRFRVAAALKAGLSKREIAAQENVDEKTIRNDSKTLGCGGSAPPVSNGATGSENGGHSLAVGDRDKRTGGTQRKSMLEAMEAREAQQAAGNGALTDEHEPAGEEEPADVDDSTQIAENEEANAKARRNNGKLAWGVKQEKEFDKRFKHLQDWVDARGEAHGKDAKYHLVRERLGDSLAAYNAWRGGPIR